MAIYVAIHEKGRDKMVAVEQLFGEATRLKAELDGARLESWIAVCGVALLQIILLYGIVWRGNKTIESQRAGLVGGRRASGEMSGPLLHPVGADLHDGPAPLVGCAPLRPRTPPPLSACGPSQSAAVDTD